MTPTIDKDTGRTIKLSLKFCVEILPSEILHFELSGVVVEDELWELTIVEELEAGIELVEDVDEVEVNEDVDDEEVDEEDALDEEVDEDEVNEEGDDEEVEEEDALLEVIEDEVNEEEVDEDEEEESEDESTSEEVTEEELFEVEVRSDDIIELKTLVTVEFSKEEPDIDEEDVCAHAVNNISISDKGKV